MAKVTLEDEHFLDKKNPLQTFDKIEFKNPKDIQNLLDWRDKNKDLVRNFNFVLEQGFIESIHNGIKIVFEKQDEKVYLDMIVDQEGKLAHFHTFHWYYRIGKIDVIHPSKEVISEDENLYMDSAQDIITVFASLMAYMEHFKADKEVIKRNSIVSNKTKKKKNGKKKTIRKITKVVYNVSPKEVEKEKRKYELSEDLNWSVKGHWRTYKNGKKVFIKPYTKGNKEVEKKQATYEM